jgi:hypothetical protein
MIRGKELDRRRMKGVSEFRPPERRRGSRGCLSGGVGEYLGSRSWLEAGSGGWFAGAAPDGRGCWRGMSLCRELGREKRGAVRIERGGWRGATARKKR